MKPAFSTLIATVLASACMGAPIEAEPDGKDPSDAPLTWLEGCWVTEDGSYREVWQRGGEELLFGFATMREDGETVFFEQMRIELDEPALYAYPRGIGPTRFAMRSVDEQAIEFTNPENSFPQIIIYRREGGMLMALISGPRANQGNVWHFAPCQEDAS